MLCVAWLSHIFSSPGGSYFDRGYFTLKGTRLCSCQKWREWSCHFCHREVEPSAPPGVSSWCQGECLCKSSPVWVTVSLCAHSSSEARAWILERHQRRAERGSKSWARHAPPHGLLFPRVPSPFRLCADPGGRAGPRTHQLHAGRGRSRGEDQHDHQLHLQRIPGGVPADRLRRLLWSVSRRFVVKKKQQSFEGKADSKTLWLLYCLFVFTWRIQRKTFCSTVKMNYNRHTKKTH